jgi:hypothetical protein
MKRVRHVTPDHYEVVIKMPDTSARKFLVIAASEAKAEAHVQGMFPEGQVLRLKTLHRHEWRQMFEVAP